MLSLHCDEEDWFRRRGDCGDKCGEDIVAPIPDGVVMFYDGVLSLSKSSFQESLFFGSSELSTRLVVVKYYDIKQIDSFDSLDFCEQPLRFDVLTFKIF